MKEQLLGFVDALRHAGLTPSVSESLDAAAAVARAGLERAVLRETLAATLVKDHADRATFDDVFDRYFALPARARSKSPAPRARREGDGAGRGGADAGRGERPEDDAGTGKPERREQRAGEEE